MKCSVQEITDRQATSERTLRRWQEEWNSKADKGLWTKKLIPNIEPWVYMTYYLTRLKSGSGCFQSYRHDFKVAASDSCIYCGNEDTCRAYFFRVHEMGSRQKKDGRRYKRDYVTEHKLKNWYRMRTN